MDKLFGALQRLYFLDGQQWHDRKPDDSGVPINSPAGELTAAIVAESLAGEARIGLDLVSPSGMARVMLINFKKAGDWPAVASLIQAVQEDLDLPPPAVSLAGREGFRVWFSLVRPVAVERAQAFLEALRLRYLMDIPVNHLDLLPQQAPAVVNLAPTLHPATGKWLAFIDPSLGGMFGDEPWLEMAPNRDSQAKLLAGFASIEAADFERAVATLQDQAAAASAPVLLPVAAAVDRQGEVAGSGGKGAKLSVGSAYSDPKSFLLAVMNDASASTRQRIKAAKALRPYFAGSAPK